MGKILVSLADEVERRLREIAKREYGGKKGSISIVIERALREWIDKHELKLKKGIKK